MISQPPVAVGKLKKPTHLPSSAPPPASAPAAAPAPWADWPIRSIPLKEIRDDGENHRIPSPAEEAEIKQLAASIARDGQLQMILVYRDVSGNFCRVFGSRRCAAIDLNGQETIAAHVMPYIPSDTEKQRLRAVENFRRRELNAAERALAAHKSFDAHLTSTSSIQTAVTLAAEDLGVSESWLSDAIHIVERLAPKTRDLLAAGGVNFNQARALAKLGDPAKQSSIAASIAKDLKPDEHGSGAAYNRGKIWSVQEVENAVANEKHQLRVVPWKLDAEMKTGVEGCNACLGCKYNTATDVNLFDTSKDEIAAGGACQNPRGFEAKQRLCAKAQEKASETIAKMLKEKKVDKAQAGSIEIVRHAAPAFVKESSAQRFVKRDLKLDTPAAAAAKKNGKAAEPEKAKPKTEKDRQQAALVKWGNAYKNWLGKLTDLITVAVNKTNVKNAAAILLGHCPLPDYDYPIQQYQVDQPHGSFRTDTKPRVEKAISPSQDKLLKAIEHGDIFMFDLLGEQAEDDTEYTNGFTVVYGLKCGPELAKRLAKTFGAEVTEPPAFEDFLPADLKPAGAKTAAPKADKAKPTKGKKAKPAVDFQEDPPHDTGIDFDDGEE